MAVTLPRAVRLLQRAEFEAALAARPQIVRRHFSVFVRGTDRAEARLGIVVSKKVAPRAVDRNRIKRMVREAFRHARHQLGGSDLVIMARRCPVRSGWDSVRGEISAVMGQLSRRNGG